MTNRRWALILIAGASAVLAQDIHRADLWKSGEGGVHTYRIPALIQTRSGMLIAVADARHDSAQDLPGRLSLVMRRSKDRGRTWEASRVIRSVEQGGVGDASLLLDRKTGRVWCFFAYGPPGIGFPTAKPGSVTGASTLQVHAMYTDDDGVKWSPPADITPQIKKPEWQAMFATSGMNIQTAKGRYLVPVVVRDESNTISVRNAYSDDAGKTWRIGPAIGPGLDESHAVESRDGTIIENMRNGKTRAVARSRDGVQFGEVEHDDALVDAVCNAGIASMRVGREHLIVFTNAASARRENLTVKLSYDGARTWKDSRVLHAGPAAYSTVQPLDDRTIAVLYEAGDRSPYERITYARFPVNWVRGAK